VLWHFRFVPFALIRSPYRPAQAALALLLPMGPLGECPPLTRQIFVLLFDKIGPVVGDPLAFSRLGAVFLGSQLTRRQQSRHGDADILGLPDQSIDECFHVANLITKMVCKSALAGRLSGQRFHTIRCALAYRTRVKQLTVRETISLSGSRMSLSAIVYAPRSEGAGVTPAPSTPLRSRAQ
jgi:hypothetical protein